MLALPIGLIPKAAAGTRADVPGPTWQYHVLCSSESAVPTAPAWLQRADLGRASWGRGPRSGGARVEGVNVDYPPWCAGRS